MSAKHIQASVILHFGHTCESTSSIPVLCLVEPMTPAYNLIESQVSELGTKIFITGLSDEVVETAKKIMRGLNKEVLDSRSSAESIIYVGNGCCVSSLIENPEQTIWTLTSYKFERHDSYQFISKRYHYISQVPESKVFGIIISSLNVYNQISLPLKSLLQKHQKVFYPIYLGRITPVKLGNFQDIDMFVMVSCKNTPLPDNRNMFRPVITPFELEVGLKGAWEGKYSTQFVGEQADNLNYTDPETAQRFSQREFKGLAPENEGSLHIERGYAGIAAKYDTEIN
jgi:diphthamide synthase subunit DPH2